MLTLARGHSPPPSAVHVRSFLWPFSTVIKLCYTNALVWSILVPGPEAKSFGDLESDIVHSKRDWIYNNLLKAKYNLKISYAAAKSLQLCPALCDPVDGSPPGSPVPGILQARTLEWVAISSSNAWKWKVKVKSLNRVRFLGTPWTAAYQAPPSMGFSRQEYWSGVPLPSPNKLYALLK